MRQLAYPEETILLSSIAIEEQVSGCSMSEREGRSKRIFIDTEAGLKVNLPIRESGRALGAQIPYLS